MSNYVQSTNFATKDALPSGDPLKIIKGTEFNTEFVNIATAIASKADFVAGTEGDVKGPASSTDNALTRFDGATGKIIQNSVGILTDAGALSGVTMAAGVITSGTLAVANGGTGATTLAGAGITTLSGTQTFTGSKTFTGGITSNDYNFNATSSIYLQASTVKIDVGSVNGLEITANNLAFNSGFGSVATAYGCRAWVNFNGTGTVAIRGSGNVSSITDNGVGDYTVNFTTAMPDSNYCAVGTVRDEDGTSSPSIFTPETTNIRTVSAYQFRSRAAGSNAAIDTSEANVAFFR